MSIDNLFQLFDVRTVGCCPKKTKNSPKGTKSKNRLRPKIKCRTKKIRSFGERRKQKAHGVCVVCVCVSCVCVVCLFSVPSMSPTKKFMSHGYMSRTWEAEGFSGTSRTHVLRPMGRASRESWTTTVLYSPLIFFCELRECATKNIGRRSVIKNFIFARIPYISAAGTSALWAIFVL